MGSMAEARGKPQYATESSDTDTRRHSTCRLPGLSRRHARERAPCSQRSRRPRPSFERLQLRIRNRSTLWSLVRPRPPSSRSTQRFPLSHVRLRTRTPEHRPAGRRLGRRPPARPGRAIARAHHRTRGRRVSRAGPLSPCTSPSKACARHRLLSACATNHVIPAHRSRTCRGL